MSSNELAESLGALAVSLNTRQLVETTLTPELEAAFEGVDAIALDVEGVDLSRLGLISLVQLATKNACFVLDVLNAKPSDPLIRWLRALLESEVVKVVHDCRMDSDALWHKLEIKLKNVSASIPQWLSHWWSKTKFRGTKGERASRTSRGP